MILDKLAEFADATALTTATATDNALVGNVIDLGASPTLKNMGAGQPVYLVISVDTAIAGVSGTSTFTLKSDDTATIHATTATVHVASPAFTTAQLVKGMTWAVALPMGETYERYLGVYHTQATATVTAGKINAFLTSVVPQQYSTFLPDGIA